MRMQFYAIEIARWVWLFYNFLYDIDDFFSPPRNRTGLNDWIYEQAQKAKAGSNSS